MTVIVCRGQKSDRTIGYIRESFFVPEFFV